MVGIKEKLNLGRSATNAQAAKLAAKGKKFNLLDKKEEKIAKCSKSCLQKNQICTKQLKSLETTGKTSRKKSNKSRARNQKKAGPFCMSCTEAVSKWDPRRC